jgi:predicted  nucleic acid-binding Zn-ribbon protein|tara:strand:+ start:1429 stop:1653 length:225 start_codon:yes stop_codon:yes gene_type:complete
MKVTTTRGNKMTTAQKAIEQMNRQILKIQIAIAEERERGSEMAEGTRLLKIAELRSEIEYCEENAAQINTVREG